MRSSLGFHTIELAYWVWDDKLTQLIEDFRQYSRATGNIKMYKDKHGNGVVKFYPEYRGLKWLIRDDVYLPQFGSTTPIINVEINPKVLGGVQDYITAATYDDIETAIANFNRISASISPLLGTFDQYSIRRVDYCVNFALNELAPGCTAEQMMSLIKKANIPPPYKEWREYDDDAHRMKTAPGSFYLMNKSVHINCYSKYMKFLEQSKKNINNGYPPIPQATMDAARDIIRFEVQCKYRKALAFSRKAKENGDRNCNTYNSLLTLEKCKDVINSYYRRTIGWGNWYNLQSAITMISSQKYNKQKQDRLINTLKQVNQSRSIPNAKALYQGSDLTAFKQTLSDLSSAGINPVTIPREWGIGRIWNLLEAYYSEESKECFHKQIEEDFFLNHKKYVKHL